MLGDSPVHPVLLSMDLAQTREFYHDKLGLEILSDTPRRSSSAAEARRSWSSRKAQPGPRTVRPRSDGTSGTCKPSSICFARVA
jgi:catechol 2,3-dioxygenase-like lactoylglutathione lyase family enzyme